ncbi:MAG TPA: hypothetical protein VIJ12_02600 [Candidatus Baltobacteraceae bacterium]
MVFTVAIAAALSAMQRPAFADTPASVQVDGVTISAADVTRLQNALVVALRPNDNTIPLQLTLKTAAEMPPYDSDFHYAGTVAGKDGHQWLDLWVNRGSFNGGPPPVAMTMAILLALADGGYGGPAFKQLYDTCAKQDAALPADAPDPFLNRRKLSNGLLDATGMRAQR